LTHGAYATNRAYELRELRAKNAHFSRHGNALSKPYKIGLAGEHRSSASCFQERKNRNYRMNNK